jgi:PAS domain S-box-containing protein
MADAMAHTLLEAVADGVLITNGDRSIVELNAAAATMFGYQRDELLGRSLPSLIRGRSPDLADNPDLAFLVGQRKDGTQFPIEVDGSWAETELGLLAITFVRNREESVTLARTTCPPKRLAPLPTLSSTLAHEISDDVAVLCHRIQVMRAAARDQGRLPAWAWVQLDVLHRTALRLARTLRGLSDLTPPPYPRRVSTALREEQP